MKIYQILLFLVLSPHCIFAQNTRFNEIFNAEKLKNQSANNIQQINAERQLIDTLKTKLKNDNKKFDKIDAVIDGDRIWNNAHPSSNGDISFKNIKVCFDLPGSMIYYGSKLIRIRDIANQWTLNTNLNFEFDLATSCISLDNTAADIRITFEDQYRAQWSLIGNDASLYTGHTMSLYGLLQEDENSLDFQRIVLHEFGHAIGLTHENQHKDFKCKLNINAIQEDIGWPQDLMTANYDIFLGIPAVDMTEYDPLSIMHYPIDSKYFIQDCPNSFPVNFTISIHDRELIQRKYPQSTISLYQELAKSKEQVDNTALNLNSYFNQGSKQYESLIELFSSYSKKIKTRLDQLKDSGGLPIENP